MNDELRNKVERIIGTAILKNDKNYTDDIMKVFEEWLAAHDTEVRIDEIGRIDGYAYGTDFGQYQQDRLASLRGKGEVE